jgi:heat shock protein HtpX
VNPLTGRQMMNLFSTHPPIEDRVAKLMGSRPSGPNFGGGNRADHSGGTTMEDQGRSFWDNMS